MSGAASQCDTFDYKPELIKRNGQKFDPGGKVELFQSSPGAVMKSPWEWKQHGQCGKWVSDLVPHLASCVDDIAFVHSMCRKSNVHGPATFMQNTGFVLPGFPAHGRLDLLWPGQHEREPADVRRAARFARLRPQRPRQLERRFPAGRASGHDDPRQQPESDLRPVSRRSSHVHHAESEADGLALLKRAQPTSIWRRAQAIPGSTRASPPTNWPRKLQLSAPEVLDIAERIRGHPASSTASIETVTRGFRHATA